LLNSRYGCNEGGEEMLSSLWGSKARVWVLFAVWFSLLACLWVSGTFGKWILHYALPTALPRDLGDGLEISGISFERLSPVPERGVQVAISSSRLRSILRNAQPWTVLLPPGIISDGVVIHGRWNSAKAAETPSLPFRLFCDDSTGDHPRLTFRYPVDELNRLLRAELSDEMKKEEDWVFGTYDLNQKLTFRAFSLHSLDEPPRGQVIQREFRFSATGRIRYNFQDGPIDATVTAEVEELSGACTLIVARDENRITLGYNAEIKRLDLSAKNTPPWAERKLARKLRASLERSLNKRRKKQKLAALLVPDWVPLDLVVDIHITSRPPTKSTTAN